ncbi:hypothetical protein [Roseateles violae]|uniref:Sel1 repeat family protein n=1 Tax=Roseateles violae TaxID=3058042 RepID=A0ABT8DSD9_9BURK|nr:hypothetical protein [Pelomonas sp. PFR6]MDN3919978.1 hypothetical protein [Pelomonas sp. PFR6]
MILPSSPARPPGRLLRPHLLALLLACSAWLPAQAQARDRWGFEPADWTQLRITDFLQKQFDYRARSKELVDAARADDAKAMLLVVVGVMHGKMAAVPGLDMSKFLSRASAQGLAFADYVSAFYALHPEGRRPSLYMRHLRKAADAGHLAAKQRLATEYLSGDYVPKDIAMARSLLQPQVPALRQAAKYYEAMILLVHERPENRNRLKASDMLFELINDEEHQASKLTWQIVLDSYAATAPLKNYEIVQYNLQDTQVRIVKDDTNVCDPLIVDAKGRQYSWDWAEMSYETLPNGGLRLGDASQIFVLRPVAAVDPAQLKEALDKARKLKEVCSKFTLFMDEDRFAP